MSDVAELLGTDSPFAQHIDGYRPRAPQIELAVAVEQALLANETLMAEAGTGVGKTFAYLIPAVASGKKVIVSTGTKNLQDQLFDKDLPLVRDVLANGAKVALLKGRGNYICKHRLQSTVEGPDDLTPYEQSVLRKLSSWSKRSKTGDLTEFGDGDSVPNNLASRVTSNADNCPNSECSAFKDCFVTQVRRKAMEADVVVVNHHLLCADMALKEGGFGEVLPSADAVIVDEAHQLPEVAAQFFGKSLSSGQLIDLARDIEREFLVSASDVPTVVEAARSLEKIARDLRLMLPERAQRSAWQEAMTRAAEAHLDQLLAALKALIEALEPVADRSHELETGLQRAEQLHDLLQDLQSAESQQGHVRWVETYIRHFVLHSTPIEMGERFGDAMKGTAQAWVFTSATLTVRNTFDHFIQQIGVEPDEQVQLPSPFPYSENACFFVPRGLPDPNDPAYTQQVVEMALPLLNASGGRAFMLFTSYRALNIAAELLADQIDMPLLVQGKGSRSELLNQFRTMGNAVLLGAASFWEGVDVRGSALSLVIIDKLPFAALGDPVMQARSKALRDQGRDPFNEWQLPQAVIALKQGVGRLIRDDADTGLLMVCDPRLLKRKYGYTFLESLPDMRRTRDPAEALLFIREKT